MRTENAKKGWEAHNDEEYENNKSRYQFWEKKLHMALNKGDKRAEEEARKHLDYWKELI